MPKQESGDFQITVNKRTVKAAATLIGGMYTTATGDPHGAVYGRLLDGITDLMGIDVRLDADTGKLHVTRKARNNG